MAVDVDLFPVADAVLGLDLLENSKWCWGQTGAPRVLDQVHGRYRFF